MPDEIEKRLAIYDRLQSQIGVNNPLHELQGIPIPNDCRIFCKEEYRNPTGSHYDRETLALLRGKEMRGDIILGDPRPLLETTTGSSGASFAWMCRVLGFKCKVIIPEDMPSARIEQIRSFDAEVELAPRGKYIGGLVSIIKEYVFERRIQQEYQFTNHSTDTEFGPQAMADLGREMLADLSGLGLPRPDYFVSALGNGISANGIASVLCPLGTRLVGMEPYESPTVLRERFPAEFRRLFPKGHRDTRHQVYGTGAGEDADIEFPNITQVADKLDHIRLPRPGDWRTTQLELLDREAKHVGNSSAACVWAALDLAAEAPRGSTILTIFYDAYWRYLPIRLNGAPA